MSTEVLFIETAKPEQGHTLNLRFNDGACRTIDFAPFLSRSQHPQIRSFIELDKFASFRVEHGDLVWGDYDLCFPITDLYAGRV
jgi:Protein of unknown function (DUF2442)